MSPATSAGPVPRGFFGVGVWRARYAANVGMLWRTAATYDAAFLAVVAGRYRPRPTDTTNAPASIPLVAYADMDDLVAHLPLGCRLVGVELDERAVPLDEYTHPRSALYLLGGESDGLPAEVLDRCDDVVAVPSPRPWSVNVAVAGSIVVADRYRAHRARSRER